MTKYFVPELIGLRAVDIPDTKNLSPVLQKGIYTLNILRTPDGLKIYYTPRPLFNLPEKLYGNVKTDGFRILNTFVKRNANLGVLLQGKGGCGKTILAKYVCNTAVEEGLAVIVISSRDQLELIPLIINELPANKPYVFFIDEYEKMFEDVSDQSSLLTILDGVYQTNILWLFTANEISKVSPYMLNRPSRIRYNFEYDGIKRSVAESIVRDRLQDHDENVIQTMLSIVDITQVDTFDTILSLIEEVKLYPDASANDIIENFSVSEGDIAINRPMTDFSIDGKPLKSFYAELLPNFKPNDFNKFLLKAIEPSTTYLVSYKTLKDKLFGPGVDDDILFFRCELGRLLMGYNINEFKDAKIRISPNRDSIVIKNGPFNRPLMSIFTNTVIIYDIMSKCKIKMTGKPIAGKLTEPYVYGSKNSFIYDLLIHGRVVEKCLREHLNDKSFDNGEDQVKYLIEVILNEVFTALISVVEEYYRSLNIEGEYLINLAKQYIKHRTAYFIKNDIQEEIEGRYDIPLEDVYRSITNKGLIDFESQIVRLVKLPIIEILKELLYKLVTPIGEQVNNTIFDGCSSIDYHIIPSDSLYSKEDDVTNEDVADMVSKLEEMVRVVTPDDSDDEDTPKLSESEISERNPFGLEYRPEIIIR